MSPKRHLEPSDSSLFLDPDSAILTDTNPQLSNIDCSPQIVNKQLDEAKAKETNEDVPLYAYEQPVLPSVDVDVLSSNTSIANRRRQKRRTLNRVEQTNDDDDKEVENILSSHSTGSRSTHRASTSVSMNDNLTAKNAEKTDSPSLTTSQQHSASENDLILFQIDDDKQSNSSTPFVDAHSRMNSIDSRQRLLPRDNKTPTEADNDESYSSSAEDNDENITRTRRTFSNPIPIEVKPSTTVETLSVIPSTDESNSMINTIFSQSAPITTKETDVQILVTQTTETPTFYLEESFSNASSFEK